MAINATTLTAAVDSGVNPGTDTVIAIASATGAAAGKFIKIDDEFMQIDQSYSSGLQVKVKRGQNGTRAQTHPNAAQVRIGAASDDFGRPGPLVTGNQPIAGKGRPTISYSAAGAIDLPVGGNDGLRVLNGTTILAMTLADPTTDMDGTLLFVAGNGKAAHTVTYTNGLGNVGATADVLTFSATQAQAFMLVACGGFWNLVGVVAGAATVAGVGLG